MGHSNKPAHLFTGLGWICRQPHANWSMSCMSVPKEAHTKWHQRWQSLHWVISSDFPLLHVSSLTATHVVAYLYRFSGFLISRGTKWQSLYNENNKHWYIQKHWVYLLELYCRYFLWFPSIIKLWIDVITARNQFTTCDCSFLLLNDVWQMWCSFSCEGEPN